jgi:hypothetical protein
MTPTPKANAALAGLRDTFCKAAKRHIEIRDAAIAGAWSARGMMRDALREGSATEARRHRERRDWYLDLAYTHKHAALSIETRSAA